jgi:hypothetical protein
MTSDNMIWTFEVTEQIYRTSNPHRPIQIKLKHFLGAAICSTLHLSPDLGLDCVLPHGEVLFTLLFSLGLQRKLHNKTDKCQTSLI